MTRKSITTISLLLLSLHGFALAGGHNWTDPNSWLKGFVHFLEHHPSASTMESMLKRLKQVDVTKHPPAMRLAKLLQNGNKGISPEIDQLIAKNETIDWHSDVDTLLESLNAKQWTRSWHKANQIAGYSNSLSIHTTAWGLDLNGLIKVLPFGPLPITEGNLERARHSSELNDAVKVSLWGNFIATTLKIPFHTFDFSDSDQFLESFQQNAGEIGLVIIGKDILAEMVEILRQPYYAAEFLRYGELSLAGDSLIKALSDLQQSSRRLRKFIGLVPNGNEFLIAFQNTLSLPIFFLDYEDSYVDQIKHRYASLQEQPYGSAKYYAELNSLAIKAFEPILASLHLLTHGLGTKSKANWKCGRAHHVLNLCQYATGALLVSGMTSYAISELVKDSMAQTSAALLPENFQTGIWQAHETLRDTLKIDGVDYVQMTENIVSATTPAILLIALHRKNFGQQPLDLFTNSLKSVLPILMINALADDVLKYNLNSEVTFLDKAEILFILAQWGWTPEPIIALGQIALGIPAILTSVAHMQGIGSMIPVPRAAWGFAAAAHLASKWLAPR
ncbi:MAG: hypothetical protein I8H75_01565 [Myxococcaceae bacterium]|nr:hypothetical protein [Myxococcaceae bacterium]MBH2006027.1 hypothetical protein [Myxococcaceae bacterium]